MTRAVFALWSGMATAFLAIAQPMPEAATQLAARISSLLPRRATVSLEYQNLAALPAAEFSSFRNALEQELTKTGLAMAAAAQPESRLRVTLSENTRGLLFVAEIGTDNQQVAMLPWNAPPPTETEPRVKISMQPVREQSESILDLLLLDSGSQLLVLGLNKVSSYRLVNGAWIPAGIANILLMRPLPRDPRGRIEGDAFGFHIYLPGTSCQGLLQSEPKLNCASANDAWPLNPRDPTLAVRWVTDRNLLQTESARGEFYNAAAGWFVAPGGHIQSRAGEPLTGADGWGSDLSSIENPCAPGILVVATGAGDTSDGDRLQAYEVSNGQATAASQALNLPGPVMALWPAETPGQSTLIVRNSKTGHYEASRLGLACAN